MKKDIKKEYLAGRITSNQIIEAVQNPQAIDKLTDKDKETPAMRECYSKGQFTEIQ